MEVRENMNPLKVEPILGDSWGTSYLKCLNVNGEVLLSPFASSSRTVYRYQNVVLKISSPGDDDGQSKQEWEIWNKLESEDRKYFVPTLEFLAFERAGIEISVQPFVEIVTQHDKVLPVNVVNKIKELKSKYGITDLDECPCRNWTLKYDDSGVAFPLIYDYGYHLALGLRGCNIYW